MEKSSFRAKSGELWTRTGIYYLIVFGDDIGPGIRETDLPQGALAFSSGGFQSRTIAGECWDCCNPWQGFPSFSSGTLLWFVDLHYVSSSFFHSLCGVFMILRVLHRCRYFCWWPGGQNFKNWEDHGWQRRAPSPRLAQNDFVFTRGTVARTCPSAWWGRYPWQPCSFVILQHKLFVTNHVTWRYLHRTLHEDVQYQYVSLCQGAKS